MTSEISIRAISGLPEISAGTNLADCILEYFEPEHHDVLVISQKLVSKAESRVVPLNDQKTYDDLIRAEAVRIVRQRGDLIITETKHGFVCANSGVDRSNIEPGHVVLLPEDPDYSAQRICDRIKGVSNVSVGIIVTDTFGRPWRRGVTDIALGCAGIAPILNLSGTVDRHGNTMTTTEICLADELASAAELVRGKSTGNGVVLIRGGDDGWFGKGTIRDAVVRPPEEDLFR